MQSLTLLGLREVIVWQKRLCCSGIAHVPQVPESSAAYHSCISTILLPFVFYPNTLCEVLHKWNSV